MHVFFRVEEFSSIKEEAKKENKENSEGRKTFIYLFIKYIYISCFLGTSGNDEKV